jgi:hypothetical protein
MTRGLRLPFFVARAAGRTCLEKRLDRSEFNWLLRHASALPILAMRQMLDDLEQALAAQPPVEPETLTDAMREERTRIRFAEMDARIEADPELAALIHFDFNVPPVSQEEAVALKQKALEDDLRAQAAMAAMEAEAAFEAEALPDGPIDFDRFLVHAYARPSAAVRLDVAIARADLPSLAARVAQLPGDLPPLTAPMDGAGLARWLALFRTEDARLEALVFEVGRCDADG